MKILVFEHCLSEAGHPVPYARQIADAIAARGCQPIVAFPDAIRDSKAINEYFPNHSLAEFNSGSLEFYEAKQGLSPLKKAKDIVSCFDRVVASTRPDHILVPTADLFAFACGLDQLRLRSHRIDQIPTDILLMRGDFAHAHVNYSKRKMKWLKWKISTRLKWNRLAVLDPFVWFQEKQHMNHLELCPDPVPMKPQIAKQDARQAMGLPIHGRLIVSCGNQNEEKGVDLLLKAFASAPIDEDDYLVLIGPLSEKVKQTLHRDLNDISKRRIISIDRFVTETEFQNSLMAADVVAVPYRKTDRPSGIICRCLAWGIPIVGANHGWPKWAKERFDAGCIVDIYDQEKFGAMLVTALRMAADFKRSSTAASYAEFNTLQNFKDFWCVGFESRFRDAADYHRLDQFIGDQL